MWPWKCPIHLRYNPGKVQPTVCQLCTSEGISSLLLHPALRWTLMGVTGCSDVYGYNLIVSYAGEEGRHFQVEGEEAFALLPPSPFRRRFTHTNP